MRHRSVGGSRNVTELTELQRPCPAAGFSAADAPDQGESILQNLVFWGKYIVSNLMLGPDASGRCIAVRTGHPRLRIQDHQLRVEGTEQGQSCTLAMLQGRDQGQLYNPLLYSLRKSQRLQSTLAR